MIRRSEKSSKEEVSSTECFPLKTRCCACFSDCAHTCRIQGVLIFGGNVLSGHYSRQQTSGKNEGYLFSEGYLFTGFYGSSAVKILPPYDQYLYYYSV